MREKGKQGRKKEKVWGSYWPGPPVEREGEKDNEKVGGAQGGMGKCDIQ